MTKEEIIKLYLSDLKNILPDSPAKRSRIIDLEEELEQTESENERLKSEREWISVEDKNINWPDYEVLGFDGETYMVGTLGCESNGDVFVQDDLMQLSNITHYRILTKPQPPKQ